MNSKWRNHLSEGQRRAWKEGRRKIHPNTLNNLKTLNKGKFGTNHPAGEAKHPAWKGDNVGYSALHSWVRRRKSKPDTCEHCGKSGFKGTQIHWASKSRKYKRDLNDWIRLCAKCHSIYDENFPPPRRARLS